MLQNLDNEQKSFYEERMKCLINHLSQVSNDVVPYDALTDQNIIEPLAQALIVDKPKKCYKVEPLRYKIYHFLFNLPLPEIVIHWLKKRFLVFPSK